MLDKPPLYQSGDKYGYLTLTGKSYMKPVKAGSIRYVECICICGKIWFTLLQKLKSGGCKSCGCRKMEFIIAGNTTHGMASNSKPHTLYRTWNQIKDRCFKPNIKAYVNYGGRGITVCPEWISSFDLFYKWCIDNGWQKGLTLDRINNNGNYEPNNCRWVDYKVQSRNKRTNINLTAFGETKCLTDWSLDNRCVVGYSTLQSRIVKWGWDTEKALTFPKLNAGGGRKKVAA